MTAAEAKRLAAFDAFSGADQLRAVVRVLNEQDEESLDSFTAAQLHALVRVQLSSDWCYQLSSWTARQRSEALLGQFPRWDDSGAPVYE